MRTLNQVNLKAQLLSVRIFTFCFSLFFTDLKGLNTAIIFYINDTIILFFKYFFFVKISTFLTLILYKWVFVIQEKEQLFLPHQEFQKRKKISRRNFKNKHPYSPLISNVAPWRKCPGSCICNCSTGKQTNKQTTKQKPCTVMTLPQD